MLPTADHPRIETLHSRELDALLEAEVLRSGVAPQASAAVATKEANGWQIRLGHGGLARTRPVYDLASLTKPFVALTTVLWLEQSRFTLSSPLQQLLPELTGSPGGARTLEQHLSHRTGLLPHLELFVPSWEGAPVERLQLGRLAASAGSLSSDLYPPVYSDLGYLLVGLALELQSRRPLDELVHDHVVRPLGLQVGSCRQWLARDERFFRSVAPTEHQRGRGGLLVGVVHDDNAWAIEGSGCAGHAGLFGTAEAIAAFGCHLLDGLGERGPLARQVEPLVRPRPGGSLRMGFDGTSGTGSSAGQRAGPRTFGHLGFTGTSIWCDPDAERVTVLLTNRVHPHRNRMGIREVRPRVHDQLWQL